MTDRGEVIALRVARQYPPVLTTGLRGEYGGPMDDKTDTQAKAGAIIVPVTLFEQNCTIIWHEPTKKAVVIDPGGDVPKILAAIKQTGVTVEKIWLTHGHIDHVGGAAELRDALKVPDRRPAYRRQIPARQCRDAAARGSA